MLTEFVAFTQYMGVAKALIMVIAFYTLMWAYKAIPKKLSMSNNKLAKILLINVTENKGE